MTLALWLLILLGPFLVVAPTALLAELSMPGLFTPSPCSRPRPVARPRPARLVARYAYA